MPVLNDVLAGSLAQAVQVQQIIDALKGTPSKGVPVSLTALSDSTNYALTVQNDDTTNSRALLVLKANGTTLIEADATGVTLGSPLNLPSGSITTSHLATAAVTSNGISVGTVSAPTTTATSPVDLDLVVNMTTVGGDVLVWLLATMTHSVANGTAVMQIGMDGTDYAATTAGVPVVSLPVQLATSWKFPGLAAGSHTFKGRWFTFSGTLTAVAMQRQLIVMELKR